MNVSSLAAAAQYQPSTQQLSQSSGHHRQHNGRHASLTDVDAQSSSIASAPSATGRIGSKLDVSV